MENVIQRASRPARNLGSLLRKFSTDAVVERLQSGEIGMVSGIPEEHLHRKFRSSLTISSLYLRWENPLMGWTSTGDPYAKVDDSALSFDSEEAAKSFAERHGWDFMVKKRQTPVLKVKTYADNFKWKGPLISSNLWVSKAWSLIKETTSVYSNPNSRIFMSQ